MSQTLEDRERDLAYLPTEEFSAQGIVKHHYDITQILQVHGFSCVALNHMLAPGFELVPLKIHHQFLVELL